ncbi:MAG: hypothetical protein L6R42_000208 [Xanthoria sp. 1 TBL-2021]|nr:MAG: hypothetical protein L6R42_000208 [Xanthoria sp. 1 TBL-2021]
MATNTKEMNTNDVLIDIHTRLMNLTHRLDIGFASLNLVMAQIQLSLITYHGSGVPRPHEDSSQELAGLRTDMKSLMDDGVASRAIVTVTEDARDRLKGLMEGFDEVVGIVEGLRMAGETGNKDKQHRR